MTPATLTAAGEALYGPLWQSDLAQALGVNRRTVSRWKSGQNEIPEGLAEDLWELMARRADLIEMVMAELRRG